MLEAREFERRVAEYFTQHRMAPAGARLTVAVSGGADSVCLLSSLLALQNRLELELALLHVNHGLRGEESDADEAFVTRLATRLALPIHIQRADPSSIPETGIEEWARDERLRAYREALENRGFDRVATGHTARDQAETVLFRLLRGTGTRGLGGISPVSSHGIVRPLLWARHEDVVAYLRTRGIDWREDASNRDSRFARNALRNQWLPDLRESWNPRLDEALVTTAEILREESCCLDRIAHERASVIFENTAYGFETEAIRLREEPVALQRRIVRLLVERLGGAGWDFPDVERARALATEGRRSAICRAGGVLWERSGRHLRVALDEPDPARFAGIDPHDAGSSGSETGVRIGKAGNYPISSHAKLVITQDKGENSNHSNGLRELKSGYTEGWSFIRPSVLRSGLTLRKWRSGDAYQPAGFRSTKKLKELFQRHSIPRWRRRDAIVLETDGEIVWSNNFGPSASHLASPSDPGCLAVRVTENR